MNYHIKVSEDCPHLFLNQGEKICKPCRGWGFKIYKQYTKNESYDYFTNKRFPRCLGRGALEFIDAAVGYNRDLRWK